MITAKYPLIGTKDFLEVIISQPEQDPESKYSDQRCECKILATIYEKKFYVYGVDEIQSVWLGLRKVRKEISDFEKETKMKCEYHYFQDFEE
jgi:hypothetical protein